MAFLLFSTSRRRIALSLQFQYNSYMDLREQIRRRAQEEGVAEDYVLGAALARESLLWFFRAFPRLAIFVGGNVLHLIYGSPRYSRDVDLFPYRELGEAELAKIAEWLERKLPPLAALLRQPINCRVRTLDPPTIDIQLAGRRQVALEFSRIAGAVGRTETRFLRSESLASELVICPVLDELLFLKLKALLQRKFLKARDVFDLWYLLNLDAKLDEKEFEHWLSLEEIESRELRGRLDRISPRRLEDDLAPLLPTPWLTKLRADNYASIIRPVKRLLRPFAQP